MTRSQEAAEVRALYLQELARVVRLGWPYEQRCTHMAAYGAALVANYQVIIKRRRWWEFWK